MSHLCLKPLATQRALFMSMEPSAFLSIMYTHLQSIMFCPTHMELDAMFCYSTKQNTSIACFQFLLSNASTNLCVSPVDVKQLYLTIPSVYTLGFQMLLYSLVLGGSPVLPGAATDDPRAVPPTESTPGAMARNKSAPVATWSTHGEVFVVIPHVSRMVSPTVAEVAA
jgi:hypothetical protein